MILVSKAPALVWEARMTGTGKIGQLVPQKPWPYVHHYSFHILDPDGGHLTIKMSGHPPFGAQVISASSFDENMLSHDRRPYGMRQMR
jgi:hypothetical protein